MGYVFQDKYSKQIHNQLITFDEESFDRICYDLKDKLNEDHCYNLQCIFDVLSGDTEEKCQEEQSPTKKLPYSISPVRLTPLRLLFRKREPSIHRKPSIENARIQ
jgi:hypothetical protein